MAEKVYENQDRWWAKGIMDLAALGNSEGVHMLLHSTDPDMAFDPIGGAREAFTGRDALTGAPIGFGQATLDTGIEAITMFGGEVAGLAIGETLGVVRGVVPSVARNVAMMLGDDGVSNSLAGEFDTAVGISDKIEIATLTSGNYHFNPKDISFTQPNAGPYFSNGSRVDELIKKLRAGDISPYDLPPIQVVQKDGRLFSIDNRRLLAFNAAGIDKIPVEMVSMNDPDITRRLAARNNPIDGIGRYVVVVNRAERAHALQLLVECKKIKGVNNGY